MPTLEFTLDPADIPFLVRWPGIRPARSFPFEIAWFDTPTFDLAARNLTLSRQAGLWSLARLGAGLPSRPASPLSQARHSKLLGHDLPPDLMLCARLVGRRKSLRWTGPSGEIVELCLQDGRFTPGTAACHLTLSGPVDTLPPLVTALASRLAVHVPRNSLAEQALAAARGDAVAPLPLGAPDLAADVSVTASLATIIAHLLAVLLHWSDHVRAAQTPDPVHQMRVATRRLRSALSAYKHVASCPGLAALDAPVRACAARLGAARDWDVFLENTAPHLVDTLAETLPGDPRCAAMLRAAARRRHQAYDELRTYLRGSEFRTLAAALACAAALRPWDDAAPSAPLQQPASAFASSILTRRLHQVRKAGRHLETLSLPALHALRKDCKRLRYAAEFFRPLLPATHAKRFFARLSALQEELGLLNDTASIGGLMAQLGPRHAFAAGLAEGFSAVRSRPARARIAHRWKAFKQTKPFW